MSFLHTDTSVTCTVGHILASDLSAPLAQVASRCSSVIVCRTSPSQKASIVRMMADYELRAAEGAGGGGFLGRWARRYKRRMENKMLSIGDGARLHMPFAAFAVLCSAVTGCKPVVSSASPSTIDGLCLVARCAAPSGFDRAAMQMCGAMMDGSAWCLVQVPMMWR